MSASATRSPRHQQPSTTQHCATVTQLSGCYPLSTVLAEKPSTAVHLGAANSRVRDYADIWTLTGIHDVDGDELRAALETTATHRGVDLRPLSQTVADLAIVRTDAYGAYRRRLGEHAGQLPADLATLIVAVTHFSDPVLAGAPIAASRWHAATRTWQPIERAGP